MYKCQAQALPRWGNETWNMKQRPLFYFILARLHDEGLMINLRQIRDAQPPLIRCLHEIEIIYFVAEWWNITCACASEETWKGWGMGWWGWFCVLFCSVLCVLRASAQLFKWIESYSAQVFIHMVIICSSKPWLHDQVYKKLPSPIPCHHTLNGFHPINIQVDAQPSRFYSVLDPEDTWLDVEFS